MKDPAKVKLGRKNKRKGKVREREVANILKARGLDARRSQQYAGSIESSDVVCDKLSEFHIEVKGQQNINLYAVLDKCLEDCKGEKKPLLFWKRDRKPWLAVLSMEDFIYLVIKGLH